MIQLILLAIFFLVPDCQPIQELRLCGDPSIKPCIKIEGFSFGLELNDQAVNLGSFEHLQYKTGFIWPVTNGRFRMVLGLDTGDRQNTVLPKFFEISSEGKLDTLPPLAEELNSLPEGSVSGKECVLEQKPVNCILLSRAIIHYNSAPPFLMQTVTLFDHYNQKEIYNWRIKPEPVHPIAAWQHLNLAKELLEKRDYETSERHYREGLYLLSKDPIMYPDGTHARLRYDFGLSLLKLQKMMEAKTVLNSVLEEFSNTSASEDLKNLISNDSDARRIFTQQRKQ